MIRDHSLKKILASSFYIKMGIARINNSYKPEKLISISPAISGN
jgi:hypothetical protein